METKNGLKELLHEMRGELAAAAAKPAPRLSRRERAAFTTLFEEFSLPASDVASLVLSPPGSDVLDPPPRLGGRRSERLLQRRRVGMVFAHLKIPVPPADIDALPETLTLDEFLCFRQGQISGRTKRDKLRQAFVTLSEDGARIPFGDLVGHIAKSGPRSRAEAEKIARFVLGDADGEVPESITVDACVDFYFTVRGCE